MPVLEISRGNVLGCRPSPLLNIDCRSSAVPNLATDQRFVSVHRVKPTGIILQCELLLVLTRASQSRAYLALGFNIHQARAWSIYAIIGIAPLETNNKMAGALLLASWQSGVPKWNWPRQLPVFLKPLEARGMKRGVDFPERPMKKRYIYRVNSHEGTRSVCVLISIES